MSNTQKLADEVNAPDFTFEAFQIANGAKELLDEVADRQGHRRGGDLVAHRPLGLPGQRRRRPRRATRCSADVVAAQDPDLAKELDTRFAELEALLAAQGSLETGFTYYDKLTAEQVKALAAAVDALSEPLSQLTTTVTGS